MEGKGNHVVTPLISELSWDSRTCYPCHRIDLEIDSKDNHKVLDPKDELLICKLHPVSPNQEILKFGISGWLRDGWLFTYYYLLLQV